MKRLVAMTRSQIIFLVLLPLCAGQFSIQGPSDGHRRAQGLKYSQDKGIEYEDQRASLGAGDFSIQGASDGNNDFKIVGASDGNSDFQIHGATDGRANYHIQGATDGNADFQIQGATDGNTNFQIQGATDGHSQSVIQSPYDANQGHGRALQYRDPSGLSVNWKSYQSAPQHPPQHAAQPTHNVFIPNDAPIPQRAAPRHRAQAQHQQAPAAPAAELPEPRPNYRPYGNAPDRIKQLLQFQQQIPYLNIIPEQYRYDTNNGPAQAQPAEPQYESTPERAPVRHQPAQQNQYRSQYRGKARGSARSKRQAPQHRATQPPVEPQPHYSGNVPSRIQDLLKFQANIPYVNHIPEQWRYDALAAGKNFKQEVTYQYPNQYKSSQPVARPDQGHRQKRQAPRYQSQIRQARQHQQQQQQPQQHARQPQYQRIAQPPPEPQPNYSTNLPSQLQQLLKFQATIPYVNSIPEQFRYENLLAQQGHRGGQAHPRQRRQAQYQGQQQAQQHQPQYQRISQPPAEPQPQYSTSVPASIQKILQFQAQTPYNIIANQINYRLDKPYVPQRVDAPRAQQPQYQAAAPQYQQPQHQPAAPQYQSAAPQYQSAAPQYQSAAAQYQPQARQYQSPASQYQTQAAFQGQPGYGQPGSGVRPVTENQY